MKKKKKITTENYNHVMVVRSAIRRAFSRSPWVIEMMNNPNTKRYVPKYNKDGSRAKKDQVEHLCGVCSKWVKSTGKEKVTIDHIDPVVDPDVGFVDFNTYVKRMFCTEYNYPKENLQKVCFFCHNSKTQEEWHRRRFKLEEETIFLLELSWDKFSKEEIKKFLKKFTPKKLQVPPYTNEFVQRVIILKEKLKLIKKS